MRYRICDEPVTATGDPYIGEAIHRAMSLESGQDGHLATPPANVVTSM